jgi:hypothetical protein
VPYLSDGEDAVSAAAYDALAALPDQNHDRMIVVRFLFEDQRDPAPILCHESLKRDGQRLVREREIHKSARLLVGDYFLVWRHSGRCLIKRQNQKRKKANG